MCKIREHNFITIISISVDFFFLKHKDSFGKYENLPKIFYAEILVYHPDYECKASSSNDQL